jgi:pyruvate kinase
MKYESKRVKIVATIGPASSSLSVIKSLIQKGVNVFRCNFSHGDHQTHAENIRLIREASAKVDREVALLADLQGPKIRTRLTEDNKSIHLKTGAIIHLTSRNVLCTNTIVAVDYKKIAEEVDAGQDILINDGAIRLTVTSKLPSGDLKGKVVSGGVFSSHKGVNFPNVNLSIPSLTIKDRKDLAFILNNDFQYIALSFVRKGKDVAILQKLVQKKRKDIKVIAKIEKPEATDRIDEILKWSDGIMVARGDLGVEATPFIVPIMQKDLIQKANNAGKIVIVATQMLESMIEHALPTRAESTDVANAIIDGSDAIMLSGETAMGAFPDGAVTTMKKIALETEKSVYIKHDMIDLRTIERFPPHAICEAAVWAGRDLGGIPICVFTLSGSTAFYLAKLRYEAPVYAFSPDIQVVRMLALAWNIEPKYLPFARDIVQLHHDGEALLVRSLKVRKSDLIGIISGTNAVRGATNSFRIKEVGMCDR